MPPRAARRARYRTANHLRHCAAACFACAGGSPSPAGSLPPRAAHILPRNACTCQQHRAYAHAATFHRAACLQHPLPRIHHNNAFYSGMTTTDRRTWTAGCLLCSVAGVIIRMGYGLCFQIRRLFKRGRVRLLVVWARLAFVDGSFCGQAVYSSCVCRRGKGALPPTDHTPLAARAHRTPW